MVPTNNYGEDSLISDLHWDTKGNIKLVLRRNSSLFLEIFKSTQSTALYAISRMAVPTINFFYALPVGLYTSRLPKRVPFNRS